MKTLRMVVSVMTMMAVGHARLCILADLHVLADPSAPPLQHPPRSDVQVSANKQRRHDITLQQPPQLPNTAGARVPPDNAIAQLLDETGHVTADDREICDGAGRGDAAVEQ